MMPQALHLSDDISMDDPLPAAVDAPAGDGPPAVRTDRDVQRGALRDLVSLAADSATTESDIEREYRTGQEQAKTGVGDRAFAIDQRHRQAVEEAEIKHKSRLAELSSQYKSQRNKIAAAEAAAKQKADAERQSVDSILKKKYNDAVWLAESVLESANGQAGLAFKQKNEAVNTAVEELSASEVTAARLLQRYGMALPRDTVEVDPDPAIDADADAAFTAHRAVIDGNLSRLGRMALGNLFVGARPVLAGIFLTAAAGGAVYLYGYLHNGSTAPDIKPIAIAAGAAALISVVVGVVLRVMATKAVRATHLPIRQSVIQARRAAERQLFNAAERRKNEMAAAIDDRNTEVQSVKEQVRAGVGQGGADAVGGGRGRSGRDGETDGPDRPDSGQGQRRGGRGRPAGDPRSGPQEGTGPQGKQGPARDGGQADRGPVSGSAGGAGKTVGGRTGRDSGPDGQGRDVGGDADGLVGGGVEDLETGAEIFGPGAVR